MKATTNKTRTIKARLAVLLVAVVEILSIFGNLNAHADEVTIDNVQQKVQEAAIAHVVANTMKKCVNSINTVYAWSWNGTFPKDEVYTSQKGLFGGTTNISVGPWLENRIQNKVDDGDIWCSNENGKIVSEFANALGVSAQQVICGLDDQGGLMLGYTEDNLNSQSATCSGGERFYKNSNATEKLKQIYEAYYNGPSKPDHPCQNTREHGILSRQRKERIPWHTDSTQRSTRRRSSLRFSRGRKSWARSHRRTT